MKIRLVSIEAKHGIGLTYRVIFPNNSFLTVNQHIEDGSGSAVYTLLTVLAKNQLIRLDESGLDPSDLTTLQSFYELHLTR